MGLAYGAIWRALYLAAERAAPHRTGTQGFYAGSTTSAVPGSFGARDSRRVALARLPALPLVWELRPGERFGIVSIAGSFTDAPRLTRCGASLFVEAFSPAAGEEVKVSATESPEDIIRRLVWDRENAPKPARHLFPVAVTGSRKLSPSREQLRAFLRLFEQLEGTELHHGACSGCDVAAAKYLEKERPLARIVPHPAAWRSTDKPGIDYSAGPRRNLEMMSQALALIAFPGGKGTASCIRAARRFGRPVLFVETELARLRDGVERELLLFPDP